MEGIFVNKGLTTIGRETLVAVDIAEKSTIKALEKEVKKQTGLTWLVVKVRDDQGIISWELLLPVRGGKIHIKAQSDTERPTRLYGFQPEESELFMQALKQIEQKRN